ncbi:LysR family transcriptional regulator [Devosia sp. FKR38]|uniref:LysR family transcriptional regulator n=1 Tax=Devosia sp. FKR38 TaxID=2562312 RepID=UPI0010C06E27|nr:LysR family transcriptional regulator [Devosia sp. FKR38]
MVDLEHLRTFLAVVRLGSFVAAARQLGLSPAMVGRRIQTLEERFGARLIERTTRSQRLTDTGQQFLQRATAIIEATEQLDEMTQPDSGKLSGRIRLSAPTTVGIRRLPAIIAGFVERHPEVIIEMNLSDRRVDLVSEGFDLAVRIGQLQASAMIARRVGNYRFACCASPAFLRRLGMPSHPDQLRALPAVLNLNLTPRNRWPFQQQDGTPFTVEVFGNVEIDNGEALRAAALAGAGLAYIPLDLVADDLADGGLIAVLDDWTLPSLPIHTIHPSRQLVPRRVMAFIDAVAEGFRD